MGEGVDMNLKIANRLVQLRKEHGLSQDALADKLGVSRQAISKWECGETAPDTDNLIALAELYDVTLDSLLGYERGARSNFHEEKCENTVETEILEEEPEYKEEPNSESTDSNESERENFAEGNFSFRFHKENNEENERKKGGAHFGKGGFTFDGDNGETVHISPRGIFVENEREKVDVSWSGIHVAKKDGSATWWEPDKGFPFANTFWSKLPDIEGVWFLLTVVGYLLMGFLLNAWHPAWLIFFAVPVLGGLTRPWKYMGTFPLIIAGVYLTLGFVGGWWHPGWVVFFAIPVFYIIMEFVRKKVWKIKD